MKGNIEERACELAAYIVENRTTVREAAKKFGISKSTVHKDIQERLPLYNRSLYLRVKEGGEQVKVTFRITNSADKISEINRTYTMSPNKALTVTVKPAAAQNGNLGISISIDGTTNDRPIDIEIPSDWL